MARGVVIYILFTRWCKLLLQQGAMVRMAPQPAFWWPSGGSCRTNISPPSLLFSLALNESIQLYKWFSIVWRQKTEKCVWQHVYVPSSVLPCFPYIRHTLFAQKKLVERSVVCFAQIPFFHDDALPTESFVSRESVFVAFENFTVRTCVTLYRSCVRILSREKAGNSEHYCVSHLCDL